MMGAAESLLRHSWDGLADRLVAAVGSAIALHTTLIVREDDLSLYGFATQAELDAFDLLRSVSGVGPKSALGVLSTLTIDRIAEGSSSSARSRVRSTEVSSAREQPLSQSR